MASTPPSPPVPMSYSHDGCATTPSPTPSGAAAHAEGPPAWLTESLPPPPLLRRQQAMGVAPPPASDMAMQVTLDAFPAEEKESAADHLLQIKIGEHMRAQFEEVHWVVHVDRSGSMSDLCKDGKTKADHVRHTIQNMCGCLNGPAGGARTRHTMALHSFDERTEIVFEDQPVADLTPAVLGPALEQLAPRGMTDVGRALDASSRSVEARLADSGTGPSHRVAHVFLTDGHVTCGVVQHDLLRAKVPKAGNGIVRNAFIGYGHEHCAHLLQTLARDDPGPRTGRTYHFADSLEHAGMVFGDILHRVTHEQAHGICVEVAGGRIYDADTRTWGATLEVEPLAAGDTRAWVIQSEGSAAPEVSVRYTPAALPLASATDEKTERAVPSQEALSASQFTYAKRRQECIEAMADARACLDGANPPTPAAPTAAPGTHGQERLVVVAHAVLDMAKGGQWDMVRTMVESASIEKAVLVNACPRPRRFSLLHHAVQQGHLDEARYLVAAGAQAAATRDGVSLIALVPTSSAGELRTFVEGLPQPAQPQGPPSRAEVLGRLDRLLTDIARTREGLGEDGDLAKQYKELSDDIYITRLSMTATNTSVAAMYMGARAGSARRQGGYAVGDLEALTQGQTEEGCVFRSCTAGYKVKAPGARVGASWGATKAMHRCMGRTSPVSSSGSEEGELEDDGHGR